MHAGVLARCLTLGAIIVAVACGGGGYNPSPSPGMPGQVTIVGQQAGNSFNPNPSAPATNGSVVWNNSDTVVHRIVANDDSFDTGNIAQGAASAAITVPTDGARYHCSLHPSMIGVVNSTGGSTPPCMGQYC